MTLQGRILTYCGIAALAVVSVSQAMILSVMADVRADGAAMLSTLQGLRTTVSILERQKQRTESEWTASDRVLWRIITVRGEDEPVEEFEARHETVYRAMLGAHPIGG